MKRIIMCMISLFVGNCHAMEIWDHDGDPSDRMEKIWHDDISSPVAKPMRTLTKRVIAKKVIAGNRGVPVDVFLEMLDSVFQDSTSSAIALEKEKLENELRVRTEKHKEIVALLETIKKREQAAKKSLISRGQTNTAVATVTVLVVIQQAAAPLFTPIIEPSNVIKAPQEPFNVELIDVQKIAPRPIKKVSSCRYDKFLPKNEKRYSKKKSYRIQQPCKR